VRREYVKMRDDDVKNVVDKRGGWDVGQGVRQDEIAVYVDLLNCKVVKGSRRICGCATPRLS
jgi:hypothetical protein